MRPSRTSTAASGTAGAPVPSISVPLRIRVPPLAGFMALTPGGVVPAWPGLILCSPFYPGRVRRQQTDAGLAGRGQAGDATPELDVLGTVPRVGRSAATPCPRPALVSLGRTQRQAPGTGHGLAAERPTRGTTLTLPG